MHENTFAIILFFIFMLGLLVIAIKAQLATDKGKLRKLGFIISAFLVIYSAVLIFFCAGIEYFAKKTATDNFYVLDIRSDKDGAYVSYMDENGDIKQADIDDSDSRTPLQANEIPYVERHTEKFLFVYKYSYTVHIDLRTMGSLD